MNGKCKALHLFILNLTKQIIRVETGFRTLALGVMSGTSLDGLDLCLVEFAFDGTWSFNILATRCVSYSQDWQSKLSSAHQLSIESRSMLHVEFGQLIGAEVNSFLKERSLPKPQMVCSHGHTVFHQPENGITVQIGSGQSIADCTGITCVSDFRSLDVLLGGQGAPLVPIGDELLFGEYDACLNLGGFSNISFQKNGIRKAFDICPVNIALNPLSNQLGFEFDKNGKLARSGKLNEELLFKLNALELYGKRERPSLAREWLERTFLPIVELSGLPVEDKLRTLVEHAAFQIASVINLNASEGLVLLSGGGAKNVLLVERLRELSRSEIVVPVDETIDFKEALIFAFLGVLRTENQTNVLQSVTGAKRDSCSGVIHFPRT